jgi:uncharacterized protein
MAAPMPARPNARADAVLPSLSDVFSPMLSLMPYLPMRLMRRALLVAAGVMALAATAPAFAQKLAQIPTINLRVNDNVALLSDQDESELNALVKQSEQKSDARIVILAIASTAPETIDEYATRVAASWAPAHPGSAVIIIVARDNRPDSERIAIVGVNGAESAIDRTSVARIAAEDMLPRFRVLEYRAGFTAAIEHVLLLLSGGQLPAIVEDKPLGPPVRQVDQRLVAAGVGAGLAVAFFLWVLVRLRSRRLVYVTGHRSLNRSVEPMIVGSMIKPAEFDPDTGNGFGGGFGANRSFITTRRDFGGSGASGAWA